MLVNACFCKQATQQPVPPNALPAKKRIFTYIAEHHSAQLMPEMYVCLSRDPSTGAARAARSTQHCIHSFGIACLLCFATALLQPASAFHPSSHQAEKQLSAPGALLVVVQPASAIRATCTCSTLLQSAHINSGLLLATAGNRCCQGALTYGISLSRTAQ